MKAGPSGTDPPWSVPLSPRWSRGVTASPVSRAIVARVCDTAQFLLQPVTAHMKPDLSPHRLCLAPMLDWSDRHCRMFWRRLTRRARLYTEMVTTSALLHGPRRQLLAFHAEEQPLALQLGGSDPAELARCAELAQHHGFVEVNLNCGCPSDRVRSGAFGACLMAEPARVAEGVRAIHQACVQTLTIYIQHVFSCPDIRSDTSRGVITTHA